MSTETRPGRPVSPHTTSTPDRPTGRLRPAQPHATEIPAGAKSAESSAGVIKLSAAELNTAMVHFYRGEVQRSNTWRNRLDTTTNWAVITAGATLSFAFSSAQNPHFVIPINSILVAFFLFMEARRYRYYEIWASRVRVIESGYFAPLLTGGATDVEWPNALTRRCGPRRTSTGSYTAPPSASSPAS